MIKQEEKKLDSPLYCVKPKPLFQVNNILMQMSCVYLEAI